MVRDPSYALGVLRQSSVGLTVVMAGASGGGGRWKGKEGKDSQFERLGEARVGLVGKGVQWLWRTDLTIPQ